MKLKKRDIGLLVLLLGLIGLLVCLFAVRNPTLEKSDALRLEIRNLEPREDELRKKMARLA